MKFIKHLFSGIVLQGIGLSLFAQTDKPNIREFEIRINIFHL